MNLKLHILKEYKGYTFVVFQHPRSGHLNGYVELKPIDEELLDQNQNILDLIVLI